MKKEITIKPPLTPNYLIVNDVPMPIQDFTEQELRQIGEEWTQELIAKAKKRKSMNL